MTDLNRAKFNELLRYGQVSSDDVIAGYSDAYGDGLAIKFPDERSFKRFLAAADNTLGTSPAQEMFGSFRDALSSHKAPGRHTGGTVVFPDCRISN